jgi:hypothetical protein
MTLSTARRAPIVAFITLAAASTALADASPDDAAKRLDDSLYFVRELGRGWEPLLSDVDKTLAGLASAPAASLERVRTTADSARETVAQANEKRGEPGEPRALELYEVLADTAVDEGRRPAHHRSAAGILMKRAERAERAGGEAKETEAFDLAKRALAHVPGLEAAFGTIGRLGLKVGRLAKDREDYETALEKFGKTAETLREAGAKDDSKALTDVRAEIDWVNANTGPLAVAWLGDPAVVLAVKGARADYTRANLTFAGAGKGPPQQTADKPRRLRTGKWDVSAAGEGGAPFRTSVEITPKGGEIVLLTALPEGMVVVAPPDGSDAFLIDETEWTNAQWTAVTGTPRAGGANLPVAGVKYEDAKAAAAKAGKRLPSFDQWLRAAFRDPTDKSRLYPWDGNQAETSRHFVGGESDPLPVRSRPEGRSWCGCFDLAGNCWEWVEHRGGGWLVGGGWSLTKLDREALNAESVPWHADFLRDPLPPDAVYQEFTDKADQSKYLNYRSKESGLAQAGLRCVVPLGKPRR